MESNVVLLLSQNFRGAFQDVSPGILLLFTYSLSELCTKAPSCIGHYGSQYHWIIHYDKIFSIK